MADLLLVDDDPELALIVAILGKRAGHTVTVCADVPLAWERLSARAFDLVLLDVNLPGASGLELCRRLRADEGLARVPVALFVQSGLTGDVAAGLEAGADFLIAKELVGRPAEWQRRVAEVLPVGPRGQVDGGPVEWTQTCQGSPPDDWAARLRRALSQPGARQLGIDVLRLVLRRAFADGGRLAAEAWVASRGGQVAVSPGGAEWDGQVVRALSLVAGQMGRLLGAEASAPFRALIEDAAGP